MNHHGMNDPRPLLTGDQPMPKHPAKKRACTYVTGLSDEAAKALGASTLPHPSGDFINDVIKAAEELSKCGEASIVALGGTPYEIIVAATAAFINYRKTELKALHNPSITTVNTATIHALGTGETYKLRKTITDLVKDRCAPIESIADILGLTPTTLERHARLMSTAGIVKIANMRVCGQNSEEPGS